MLDTIPVPADSKFGAMVARRLNASRPIAPVGSLAMSGPTGTGFAPLPANHRDRRTTSNNPPRQFTLRTRLETNGQDQKELVVEFCNIGPGVIWNENEIPCKNYIHTTDIAGDGWTEISRISFDEDTDVEKTYYLNIEVAAYCEWGVDQGLTLDLSHSGWEVSEEPNTPNWELLEDIVHHVVTNVAIGKVLASGGSVRTFQYFDGQIVSVNPWIGVDNSGGGGGGGETASDNSCFKIDSIVAETGAVTVTFGNPYIQIGGVMHEVSETSLTLPGGGCAAVVYQNGNISLQGYELPDDAIEDQKRKSKYVILLYDFDADGSILVDFRNAPNVQVWEDLSDEEQN